MLWRVFVSTVLLSMGVGGCVSQVQLANDKGQTAQCNAAGVGLIGAAAAASGQKDCIDRYQSQGYHQVPLPGSADAAKTPDATPTSAAATTTKPAGPATKGQADQCNTYGFGIVSSMIAASMQQTCQQQTGQTQK